MLGAEIQLAPAPADISTCFSLLSFEFVDVLELTALLSFLSVWKNANITPGERRNSKFVGFMLLAVGKSALPLFHLPSVEPDAFLSVLLAVCFFNTIPLIIVAAAANLTVLSGYVSFLADWESAGEVGNWTFSAVAGKSRRVPSFLLQIGELTSFLFLDDRTGILPPAISGIFGLLLPYLIRKLTKYQGAVGLL